MVKPKYLFARDFSDGLAVVSDVHSNFSRMLHPDNAANSILDPMVGSNSVCYVIDRKGRRVKELTPYRLGSFADGLAPVAVKKDSKSRRVYWEYMDKKGNQVSNLRLRKACSFKDGVAVVQLPARTAWVDSDGNVVWQPSY